MGRVDDLLNDMNIPPFGDTGNSLFSSQAERDDAQLEHVREINLDEISDFENHPFQVRDDEEMQKLTESVKENGVLMPALVRPKRQGGYEMVSGHRRRRASELAGKATIPCIVRDLTDDVAIILMVDSNLHREELLPSEKAKAYEMKLAAMNRQGARSDLLTSVPVGQKLGKTSREALAENSPDSNTQIQRFIRLTKLIPELMQMVDDKKIAFRPAVELSYLGEQEQQWVLDSMEENGCTPSLAQAIDFKKTFSSKEPDTQKLTPEYVKSKMEQPKPNQKQSEDFVRLPGKELSRFFANGTSEREIKKTIFKALELYQKWEKFEPEKMAEGRMV